MSATPIETFLSNLEEVWPEESLDYMSKSDAYAALKKMTGQDFGYDVGRWKEWFKTGHAADDDHS